MSQIYKINSKASVETIVSSLFLYLLLPISSLVISCLQYRKTWSKYLFILFGFYFGYCFVVPSSKLSEASDSEFYVAEFKEYCETDISFSKLIDGFYKIETQKTDVYQPLMTWLVSQFTDNYHFLFGIFGLVFSVFLTKILRLMLELTNIELKGFALLVLLTFLLINPLWNINGVRMWTALNVFLFGILLYNFKNRKMGLFYMLLSSLFHISFLLPIIFFLFYLLISKVHYIYFFVLCLMSFLVKGLPSGLIDNLSDYLPDFIKYRLDFYVDPSYVASVADSTKNTSLFILVSQYAQSFIPLVVVLYIHFYYKKNIKVNCNDLSFYNNLLFTAFWANMSAIIPSFGRFQSLSLMLIMFYLFINLFKLKKLRHFNILKLILIPLFLTIIVQKLRELIDFQSINLFIGNIFIYDANAEHEPLINLFLK